VIWGKNGAEFKIAKAPEEGKLMATLKILEFLNVKTSLFKRVMFIFAKDVLYLTASFSSALTVRHSSRASGDQLTSHAEHYKQDLVSWCWLIVDYPVLLGRLQSNCNFEQCCIYLINIGTLRT
jgi:hypothetical protein